MLLALSLIPAVTGFALSRRERAPTVTVLAPGLVLVRNALSEAEQQRLSSEAQRLGRRRENGFRNADGSLNADAARGRIYDRASVLPACFRRLCCRSSDMAASADAAMPSCDPTHCLINQYTSTQGLLWHRDIYANDGDGDKPIVNLSVGASCIFGVQDDGRRGRVHKVKLESGDALLFGGPRRFVRHAVLEVLLDEKPRWMRGHAHRLSFTFREAPSVLGQEEHYRTFQVKQKWFEETQKAWRPGAPLVAA